jgi:hypothetical protein
MAGEGIDGANRTTAYEEVGVPQVRSVAEVELLAAVLTLTIYDRPCSSTTDHFCCHSRLRDITWHHASDSLCVVMGSLGVVGGTLNCEASDGFAARGVWMTTLPRDMSGLS